MQAAPCPRRKGEAAHPRPPRSKGSLYARAGWLLAVMAILVLPSSQARSLVPRPSLVEVKAAKPAGTPQPQAWWLFLPLVSQPIPGPDGRFGIQLYDSTEEQVAEAAAAGAGQVRIPLIWAAVEPANTGPSEYRWSATYENGLARIAASDVDLILTIEGNPSWAATYPGGPIDRVPMGEFVEFVVAAVLRYSAPPYNVKLWEFYNEPDNGDVLWAKTLGYWGNEPEAYAEMLAAVYQPIKEADPEAQVLLGGIAFDFWPDEGGPFVPEFLDRVLQHGGGAHFDLLNFHYYPTAFAEKWSAYGPGLVGKTSFLRDKLATYGLEKPAVCTEAGVENINTGTDEIQSRYVPIVYVQAMAADLRSLSWFMLVDEDSGYWKTGLLYADLSRKPAFYAYQTAAARLGHARYLFALSPEEKGTAAMEAYQFLASDGRQQFTVAWSNDGQSYPLALPAARVLVSDKYGTESWVSDGWDGRMDGVTTVPVGPSPIYLYPDP
jgi:hypothetical protein